MKLKDFLIRLKEFIKYFFSDGKYSEDKTYDSDYFDPVLKFITISFFSCYIIFAIGLILVSRAHKVSIHMKYLNEYSVILTTRYKTVKNLVDFFSIKYPDPIVVKSCKKVNKILNNKKPEYGEYILTLGRLYYAGAKMFYSSAYMPITSKGYDNQLIYKSSRYRKNSLPYFYQKIIGDDLVSKNLDQYKRNLKQLRKDYIYFLQKYFTDEKHNWCIYHLSKMKYHFINSLIFYIRMNDFFPEKYFSRIYYHDTRYRYSSIFPDQKEDFYSRYLTATRIQEKNLFKILNALTLYFQQISDSTYNTKCWDKASEIDSVLKYDSTVTHQEMFEKLAESSKIILSLVEMEFGNDINKKE